MAQQQQQQKTTAHDKGLPWNWNQNTNLPCWKGLFGKKLREIIETPGLQSDLGGTHEKTSPLYTFKGLLL